MKNRQTENPLCASIVSSSQRNSLEPFLFPQFALAGFIQCSSNRESQSSHFMPVFGHFVVAVFVNLMAPMGNCNSMKNLLSHSTTLFANSFTNTICTNKNVHFISLMILLLNVFSSLFPILVNIERIYICTNRCKHIIFISHIV